MTGAELVTEVASTIGRDDIDARIVTWLNLGLKQALLAYPFYEAQMLGTIPTVADQEYSLFSNMTLAASPAKVLRVIAVWPPTTYFDREPLDAKSLVELRSNNASTTGRPRQYGFSKEGATNASALYWWPTPDDVYTHPINVLTIPAEIADDNNDLSVEVLEDVVLNFAIARGFGSMDEAELYERWYRTYTMALSTAIESDRKIVNVYRKAKPFRTRSTTRGHGLGTFILKAEG